LLYLLDFKKPDITLSKAVPIAFGAAAILAALGIIGAVVYFSAIDTTTDLGSLEQVLRFNDKWGTHRGYMWIRSMWIFADESIFDKLFGCGPDTFYYAFSPYFKGLEQYGDSSTNAAHNEYINYLITIGIAGTAAYLAVVGSVIARAVKAAKRNPLAIVCVSAVICYSVQAVVNISQPITTPLFIIFLALTEAVNNYQLTMNN
jgi:O-antigen ligase